MAKFRSNNTWEQQKFYNEAREAMWQQRHKTDNNEDWSIGSISAIISMGLFLFGLFRQDIALALGGLFAGLILMLVLTAWLSVSENDTKRKK